MARTRTVSPSVNASTQRWQSARQLRMSLIPLQAALTAAHELTPFRAPRPLLDQDEVLAARLIENIRHPEPVSCLEMQIEPPQPSQRGMILEMAGTDV